MGPTSSITRSRLAQHAARGVVTGILGLLCSACAGLHSAPTHETRQAMAPTGKLRVAFLSAPIYMTKDAATGELKGVAVDLGKELARRVNVPFDPVVYANFPALMSGAKSGEWDVALMGIESERAKAVDFSAPFMNVEQGFLLRAGVAHRGGIGRGCFRGSGRRPREEQSRCPSAPKAAEPSTMPFAQRLTCTVDDACEVTGLGRTKLYELIGAGRIVTTTIGRR